MSSLAIKVVAYTDEKEAIQFIRQTVFQIEQGVDTNIDFDGRDDAATQIVAYLEETPVATARIRYLNNQTAKIERVAVLKPYRRGGVGKQIMAAAIAFLNNQRVSVIKINAQVQVKAFYQKLGFQQYGEEFHEAGIPHIEMSLIDLSCPLEKLLD